MLKILTLVTAALVALTIPLDAQESGPQREIIEAEADGAVIHRVGGQDQIVRIRAKTRHTTVIVLPATENVLDFVVGDSEYWHLTGAANLAFLKPIAEGVTTNVALVCESGRIYSFLVTEQSKGQPHLVVRIDQEAEAIRESRRVNMNRLLSLAGGLSPISKWRRRPSRGLEQRRSKQTAALRTRRRLRRARVNRSKRSILHGSSSLTGSMTRLSSGRF